MHHRSISICDPRGTRPATGRKSASEKMGQGVADGAKAVSGTDVNFKRVAE
jgi:hypothetical protein